MYELAECQSEVQILINACTELMDLFQIDGDVTAQAICILFFLNTANLLPENIFCHGSKSIVFSTKGEYSTKYITIGLDCISFLESTPTQIIRRCSHNYDEFMCQFLLDVLNPLMDNTTDTK